MALRMCCVRFFLEERQVFFMDLMKACREEMEYAVAVRRHLHENPEPAAYELKTVRFILSELEKSQIECVNIPDGGVLGFIQGALPGKTVMLRADCDALKMTEAPDNGKTSKVCVSKVDGLAHCCGHDMHTAMLLAAAKVLAKNRDSLKGTVILMFERGEEGGGNTYYIHRYLQEQQIPVDACFAQHNDPLLPVGQIAISPGPRFAGSFGFHIKLTGKGGHGSRPDRGINPIDCFLAIATQFKDLRMRLIPPDILFTASINMVNAGSAHNIIPEVLTFSGTVRTYDFKAGIRFREKFKEIIEKNCELFECGCEILRWKGPTIPVINQDEAAQFARDAVSTAVGPASVTDNIPDLCSESFGVTTAFYPCAMAAIGTGNTAAGKDNPLHNPRYDPDEDALLYGSVYYAACAFGFTDANLSFRFEAFEDGLDALFKLTNRPFPRHLDP